MQAAADRLTWIVEVASVKSFGAAERRGLGRPLGAFQETKEACTEVMQAFQLYRIWECYVVRLRRLAAISPIAPNPAHKTREVGSGTELLDMEKEIALATSCCVSGSSTRDSFG